MIGERLKELRKERKLTQTELGNKINVTKVSISGYENGNRSPDTDTLQRLADYFDVTTDYLLGRSNVRSYTTQRTISPQHEQLIDFFTRLDDEPDNMLAALDQFELYYKLYKEQIAAKNKL